MHLCDYRIIHCKYTFPDLSIIQKANKCSSITPINVVFIVKMKVISEAQRLL